MMIKMHQTIYVLLYVELGSMWSLALTHSPLDPEPASVVYFPKRNP